jgi:phage repressor protein C with HTH and peptisase S24 domain
MAIVPFPNRHHARNSAPARRGAGTCILTSDSYVTLTPASGAASKIAGQYSTGIDPLRFCSPAVEGALPITRPKAALPPKASMSAGTVLGTDEAIVTPIYRISVDRVNRTSVDKPCLLPDMGDSSDRLKQARIRAGFKSAREAAIKNRWKPSTYASHENGQIPEVPRDAAIIYARAFKVSPSWILTGEGRLAAQNMVRVMGRIGGGAKIDPEYEQVPEGGLEEIELPMPVGPDAIAFEVSGQSMAPRYDAGTIIVCTSDSKDPEQFIGAEVAVRTTTGARYLKKLRATSRKGVFTLESFNAEPIENVKIAWLGEILWIVPAGRRTKLYSAKRATG